MKNIDQQIEELKKKKSIIEFFENLSKFVEKRIPKQGKEEIEVLLKNATVQIIESIESGITLNLNNISTFNKEEVEILKKLANRALESSNVTKKEELKPTITKSPIDNVVKRVEKNGKAQWAINHRYLADKVVEFITPLGVERGKVVGLDSLNEKIIIETDTGQQKASLKEIILNP